MIETRGHGRPTEGCTFGDREVFDVDTAVGEARRLGYDRVVTVGWSTGGTAVPRHAALTRTGSAVLDHRLCHIRQKPTGNGPGLPRAHAEARPPIGREL